ncbi:MAG: DUF3179 domain-containing (seleno)protein [Gemmataceae bacterium]
MNLFRSPLLLVPILCLVAAGCGRKPSPVVTQQPPGQVMPTPFLSPGVRNPPVQPAKAAHLADDLPVVGVVVDKRARAYTLRALSKVRWHIVNDVLDKTPVTVVYCDTFDCLRVYTGAADGEPLPLSQVGRSTDGLMVSYQGQTYAQSTGKRLYTEGPDLPLTALPHERTTWKRWREAHPETEVYDGPEAPAPEAEGK